MKFRAWDKSDRVMCKVAYLKLSEVQYMNVGYRKNINGKTIDENALLDENLSGTCVLMRYTGKHDMAGKEVYEGDVIENPGGIRMEIKYGLYDAYCPAYRCNMDSVGFYAAGVGLPEMPIGCLEDYAVVVGNVWENPELLSKQN